MRSGRIMSKKTPKIAIGSEHSKCCMNIEMIDGPHRMSPVINQTLMSFNLPRYMFFLLKNEFLSAKCFVRYSVQNSSKTLHSTKYSENSNSMKSEYKMSEHTYKKYVKNKKD